MSTRERQDFNSIDDVYLREVKNRIDASWRLQRQLERCNILSAQLDKPGNQNSFENSVLALLGDLPTYVRRSVEARKTDYTVTPEPRYQFKYSCQVPMGTIENPLQYNKPEDYDYDPNEPTVTYSPIKVTDPPYIDYIKLLQIIKAELESGGASWQLQKTLKDLGMVPTNISKSLVNQYEKTIKNLISEHRKQGYNYSYNDLFLSYG